LPEYQSTFSICRKFGPIPSDGPADAFKQLSRLLLAGAVGSADRASGSTPPYGSHMDYTIPQDMAAKEN
jgi:hypothetical protein